MEWIDELFMARNLLLESGDCGPAGSYRRRQNKITGLQLKQR